MNVIKDILENHGQIGEGELPTLAADFPNVKVVIKWGQSMRETVTAQRALPLIAQKEKAGDWVREIFIPCNHYDTLCQLLGIDTN